VYYAEAGSSGYVILCRAVAYCGIGEVSYSRARAASADPLCKVVSWSAPSAWFSFILGGISIVWRRRFGDFRRFDDHLIPPHRPQPGRKPMPARTLPGIRLSL